MKAGLFHRSIAATAVAALVGVSVAATALSSAPDALSAQSGLVVIPRTAGQPGLSYFKVAATPGGAVHAGTIELRNPTGKRLRVLLTPVDGETLDTLGSSYAQPGSRPHRSTLWMRLGAHSTTVAAGGAIAVPLSVLVPSGARPGDYLSGVSVEAVDQESQTVKKHGVSIASVSRYAIGTEVSVPGQRHALITLTGVRVRREPAGLTFALDARNAGDEILQGVRGEVRITRGGHPVVVQRIGPGTFLAGTSIAVPVNAFRQTPPEGTRYRVSAWMRYPGGIARLSKVVTFGHRDAVAQQRYGGPPATSTGTAWWKIAAVIAAILYGLLTTALLVRRRVRGSHSHAQP
jgi:hypothetical protein